MITRVGIVAKPGLSAVSADLPKMAAWLQARRVAVVFDADTAALARVDGARVVSRDELPLHVDLILLLGGDGFDTGRSPSVGRIDNPYGDRNLFCTCPPVETFATLT